jgi:hypothetical protein
MKSYRFLVFASAACACAVLASTPGLAREKTDLVYLTNGDRLTGEIKQLNRGILTLSTNAISTINIEWEDVDSLNSVYHFRVEGSHGEKHFGSIFRTRDGAVQIVNAGRTMTLPAAGVVVIQPIEAGFWHQLDGSISLGFSYTKADELAQFTFDASVLRRTVIRQMRLDVDALVSNSSSTDQQTRYDATLSYRRYFSGIWYGTVAGEGERNDELGLDLRTSALAGMGANLIRTNRTDLVAAVGISVNREWSSTGEKTDNVEGVLGAEHAIFAHDFPKVDYSLQVAYYPSLSDWGRNRFEVDLNARREIISDFFVDLSFYLSYDNRPPGGGARDDYGTVFSLGYSF